MASTYTPIGTTTTSSGTTSVTFSSLGSYTDLVLVSNQGVTTTDTSSLRFNSDGSTSYSNTQLWGPNGSTAYSQKVTSQAEISLPYSTSVAGANMMIINIPNYSNSTTFKTILAKMNDSANGRAYVYSGLWRSTAAITSITMYAGTGSFATGSTFTLYGIAAA